MLIERAREGGRSGEQGMDLGMALRGVAWRRLGALVEGVKFGFRGGRGELGFWFFLFAKQVFGGGCRPRAGGRAKPAHGGSRARRSRAGGQGPRALRLKRRLKIQLAACGKVVFLLC